MLVIVAYHPSRDEVVTLKASLSSLSNEIGYAVAVNGYVEGESVDLLFDLADDVMMNRDNPGFGVAANRIIKKQSELPAYIGILNTDLSWQPGTFERMLDWVSSHQEVSALAPSIVDSAGNLQYLCKRDPTVLALASRRFIGSYFKNKYLYDYDRWYTMRDCDYGSVFEVPYLTGCCMLVKAPDFLAAGGFDSRYFLYLEDADLTRSIRRYGKTVHFPYASVVHAWGKGNYKSLFLAWINIVSAVRYFAKWGWRLW